MLNERESKKLLIKVQYITVFKSKLLEIKWKSSVENIEFSGG